MSMNTALQDNPNCLVYVVDDDALAGDAITQTIASLACEVICFQSARECLEALESRPCDLILSDLSMPDMNGLAFFTEVKAKYPLIPVILITGYGDIPIAVESVKKGVFDFIEKPFSDETLLPLVKRGLETSRHRQSLKLSDIEVQILRSIGAGKSNKEIAFEINRSVRSVENYRLRMMRKLEVDSAAELVKISMNLGLNS